jgi:hypothetical protein
MKLVGYIWELWAYASAGYFQIYDHDEDELLLWLNNCSDFIEFREPDLNNQVTAIAKVSSGEEFKNLKLM